MASIISIFNMRFHVSSGGTCVVPADGIGIEAWAMLLVLVTWCNVGVVMLLEVSMKKCKSSMQGCTEFKAIYLRTLLAVITTSISSAMDTASAVLLTFPDPVQPSISRLRDYPTVIVSYNFSFDQYGPYLLMGIFIYVLFAFYVTLMGLSLRHHHLTNSDAENVNSKSRLIAAVQVWRECYKSEFYWMEIPMTLRRFVFSFCSKAMLSSPSRVSTLTTFLILSETALIQFKWYAHEDDNFLEIFLMMNAAIFYSFSNSTPNDFDIVSGICVITGICGFLIVLARHYNWLNYFRSRCAGAETRGFDVIQHDRGTSIELNSNSDVSKLSILDDHYKMLE
jgi:hypothetical protein